MYVSEQPQSGLFFNCSSLFRMGTTRYLFIERSLWQWSIDFHRVILLNWVFWDIISVTPDTQWGPVCVMKSGLLNWCLATNHYLLAWSGRTVTFSNFLRRKHKLKGTFINRISKTLCPTLLAMRCAPIAAFEQPRSSWAVCMALEECLST